MLPVKTPPSEALQLRNETRQLLNNRPISLKLAAIAQVLNAKGCKISEAWLQSFGQGKIENPGVITICALNQYLKNYNTTPNA